jgi:hypothetical protein
VETMEDTNCERVPYEGRGIRRRNGNTEPPVVLDQDGMKVWRGEIHKEDENGDVDRSASLLLIGRVLYDAGAMQRTVVEALKESILRRN